MRFLFPFLLSLACLNITAEVFKTTDENGNTVFSDAPQTDDAEMVEIPDTNTITIHTPSVRLAPKPGKNPDLIEYTVRISSPVNDAQYRNPTEAITVKVEIKPALHRSHTLQLSFDGVIQAPAKRATWVFENLFRGSHTFIARVINDKESILASSSPVTIHIFRHSVLNSPQSSERARLLALEEEDNEPGLLTELVGLLLPGFGEHPRK